MQPTEYKDKFDKMSLSEWMLYHQRNLHFKMKYQGLDMQKIPTDLWIYSEIINEVKPRIIIEIGAAGGGTALWLCHQLDILGRGRLISIDINHGGFKAEHKRIIKITGASQDKKIIDTVKKYCDEITDILLIHDGSHKKEDIKEDFKNYSDLIPVNSYFIIEDGVMDVFDWKDHRTSGHDCGLVAAQEIALESFSAGKPRFIIDKEKEKYIITNNPCGFLKRIK